MTSYKKLQADLKKIADPRRAKHSQRFFKTGPGEYGAGDIFIGIRVPLLRQVAKRYADLTLVDLKYLLASKIHEERLTGIFILVNLYKAAAKNKDSLRQEKIYRFYLTNAQRVNNWDLVDSSAHYIVGHYLYDKPRGVLTNLAGSTNLWERRIAIIATAYFISQGDFNDTLQLSKILLKDDHDLIHKAVGWMLREVGKRDLAVEEKFLETYAAKMPRTMLRYAIEKFTPAKRKYYLALA